MRAKALAPSELARACLDRIAALEPFLHAFLWIDPDRVMAQARAWDDRYARGDTLPPLAGLPVAVKDNMCTTDFPTSCGSRILGRWMSPYDATVVARLRAAGAIVVGKTNLDEFAMGSSTENSAFGPTRNPWDRSRVPGGSSGGSAAAVASGAVPLALGSDTGGSIRQPAGFCGIAGLKPTYGRVSRYGLVAFASSLDQIGPMARTVADAALLLEMLAGPDPQDATSAGVPVPGYVRALDGSVRGLRIGLAREAFGEGLEPAVRDAVTRAADVLRAQGAEVVEVALPAIAYALPTYYLLATSEASTNLARYDGVRYGLRAPASSLYEMYTQTRHDGFGPEVKRRIMLGTYALSAGYYEGFFLKAQRVRTLIRRDFEAAFGRVDLVLMPTSPTVPFRLGEKVEDPLQMYLADVYTIPVNLAGLPAISVPCGFVGGLPVGLQLIGRAFDEATVLRAAHAYEQATDWHTRRPPLHGSAPDRGGRA
ncbi:MAG TPA: Asp-tRNA(Asn)/Glu-tRNA(Gln) amidotransferase subunit GatA [bacterium]|nr:Asp-tRNA(Asn)/Glu-tRNA(Gln) amidotransferase subunit GatA [bacterium]